MAMSQNNQLPTSIRRSTPTSAPGGGAKLRTNTAVAQIPYAMVAISNVPTPTNVALMYTIGNSVISKDWLHFVFAADMYLLVWELGRLVKAPVVDQTGLSGAYTFRLPPTANVDPSRPSIFTRYKRNLVFGWNPRMCLWM
jgi:Protein of unknown function (DUF3738)